MKKGWGLGIVFLVIVLCSFYGMGVGTEKTLKRNIAILNQSQQIKVSLKNYHRGWFRSHAELKWTVQIPPSSLNQNLQRTTFNKNQTYTFDVPLEIYHGPIIWTKNKLYFGLGYAQTRAHLPDAVEQEIAKNYKYASRKFEYTLNVFVNYLNKTTVQFQIPQYKLSQKTGDNFFQWLGLVTNVVISGDKQSLQGDLALKGLSWKEPDMRGIVGPLNAEYDLHQTLGTLYIGSAMVHVPSMVIFHGDQPLFRINDAQISSSSAIQNGLYESSISAKVHQLMLREKSYTQAKLDLAFKNLDANVLAAINRKLNEIPPNTVDNKQRLLWALIPDLPALVSQGAEFALNNFEINMLSGHIKANLKLALPKEKYTNPLQIIQKMVGESHVSISKAVLTQWLKGWVRKAVQASVQKQSLAKEMQTPAANVENTPPLKPTTPSITNVENASLSETQVSTKTAAKIKDWVSEGILVEEGDDYTIFLKLMDGQLFINGHPFDPALLAI